MSRAIPMVGKIFGRLTVQQYVGNLGPHLAFSCLCSCGAVTVVRGHSLRNGDTTSCGCARAQAMRAKQTKHGMYGSRTYHSYRAMIFRCTDRKCPAWKDYGGRGITIDPSWSTFEAFLADMGERPPGKTLDRINNDGGYSKANCRWATLIEQARNKRNSRT